MRENVLASLPRTRARPARSRPAAHVGAALLAALACSAPARAVASPTLAQRLDLALYAGHILFPAACSPVAVVWTRTQRDGSPNPGGWTWEGPSPQSCTIYLHPALRHQHFSYLCTIVAHEVGHLAGEQHSADPSSVMYPVQLRPAGLCVFIAPSIGGS